MNRGQFIAKCALMGIIALLAFGFVTMLLWNWLVPTLFKCPEINYWQAVGLLLLTKILFWGFGGKGAAHGPSGPAPYWKHRFYEKLSNMNPQDREVFKQKMREKWCNWEQKCAEPEKPASKD